jgi:hypothetical protein
MLEAGARSALPIDAPLLGQNRFNAYIALSPQGPGIVFPENAWSSIHKPILIFTGTRDEATNGGPQSRLIPFSKLPGSPGHCQWQQVIDGATHMNFAGAGLNSDQVKSQVGSTIAAFLKEALTSSCPLPTSASTLHLQSK